MRVSMDLELKDIPGQLVLALKPVSEFKGNLISVVHHHEKRTPRGKIPVQLVFEIKSDHLDNIISLLEESGISVVSVDEKRYLEHGAVILIGHIVHTDIKDTIDKIDNTGYAEVVDLNLAMPRINRPSSASLKIDAVSKQHMSAAIELLKSIAKEKDLLVIEPIGVN
ncbi:amino acid-binding protein [Methanolobus chelungpuianus]|uniref:Amino acid-binding protein n=1 Tax=Methanolobus chelungpuianus TaxID=502115 RepID=A0AAE3H8T4_9EURY|nr:amino acid-binding protein [Methanolobus chelungpuianus]MCQ6962267.1 amino acid-binding protein [Methanolobus chelungpuianus]